MLEAGYAVPIRTSLFGEGCDEFLDAARCYD
jgi:hypothetical protein